MKRIEENEEKLAKFNDNDTERNRLQNEIKENKSKIAEEVNAVLEAEISAFPKLTARIEAKGIHFSQFFNFNKK